MADHASVGFWVRRFLSDHLVHERGVSRNTQQSYRDTFCLFLPFVAAHRKTDVDKLVIDDLSPNIVLEFLSHLEQTRSCTVATRNQRLAALHAFARYTGNSSPEHAEWCAEIRNVPFKRGWRTPVTYLEKEDWGIHFALVTTICCGPVFLRPAACKERGRPRQPAGAADRRAGRAPGIDGG